MTFFSLIQLHFHEHMAYRAHYLLSILTGPLYFAAQYFVWNALLASGAVAGYELQSIVTYFVLASLLMYWHWDHSDYEIAAFVRQGTLNNILLRPLTLQNWLFTEKLASRSIALFLEILPFSILAILVFGTEILAPQGSILIFTISIIILFMLKFIINMLVGHAAFWMTNIHGLRMLMIPVFFFLTGALFPLDILPMWAQHIVFWLPMQFIIYAPASIFTGTYSLAGYTDPWMIVSLAAGWTAALYLILLVVQKRAQHKYEGVGQ